MRLLVDPVIEALPVPGQQSASDFVSHVGDIDNLAISMA